MDVLEEYKTTQKKLVENGHKVLFAGGRTDKMVVICVEGADDVMKELGFTKQDSDHSRGIVWTKKEPDHVDFIDVSLEDSPIHMPTHTHTHSKQI